ncbi:MAG: hypothetical protein F6K00_13030 [Leptolyngbya sp. SIOISBB]|nr:hypothetical protein [Leptolyngbya sp. SIOISBB]
MSAWFDKLLHFAIGLAVGITFWWLLERYLRNAARRINPILFLIMLVWGASGLFFFRKLGIPILSHTAFYMAIPDWDIPLYQVTRLRFLIHRSWLFHSTLLPLALLGLWGWLRRSPPSHQWPTLLTNSLRDSALGLSIGMSAHLLWDALLSSTRRGFYIRGFGSLNSWLWLIMSLGLGIGIPWLVARTIHHANTPLGIDD